MQPDRQPALPPHHPAQPLLRRLDGLAACDIVAPATIGHGPLTHALRNMLLRGARSGPPDGPVIYAPFLHLARLQTPPETAELMTAAPEATLDRIRAGGGAVVFDGASEGRPFLPEQARALHAALDQVRIPPGSAAWVQQNRALGPHYRAFCAAQGLAPMRIVTADSYGFGLWQRLFAPELRPRPGVPPALWPFGFALESDGLRRHRWICLNYIVRPHRMVVAAWLAARPEPGFLSISTERIERDPVARQRFDADVAWLARGEDRLLGLVGRMIERGEHRPADTESFGASHWRVYGLPVEEVASSELFVVTETEMVWPDLHRWTEKTLKALATGLPFVVFGNHATVAGLAELGFDTLDDLVNHAYDAEPAPDRRFAMALAAVERFLARPPGFTAREMSRLREAARHNRDVFARRILRAAGTDALDEILALACGGAGQVAAG